MRRGSVGTGVLLLSLICYSLILSFRLKLGLIRIRI